MEGDPMNPITIPQGLPNIAAAQTAKQDELKRMLMLGGVALALYVGITYLAAKQGAYQ